MSPTKDGSLELALAAMCNEAAQTALESENAEKVHLQKGIA